MRKGQEGEGGRRGKEQKLEFIDWRFVYFFWRMLEDYKPPSVATRTSRINVPTLKTARWSNGTDFSRCIKPTCAVFEPLYQTQLLELG